MRAKNATRKYETLRANALGDINRATEFMLFVRKGMSSWLRSLHMQRAVCWQMREKTSYGFADMDIGLAAILADAILESARTADCRR
jgi:hypothetical protein